MPEAGLRRFTLTILVHPFLLAASSAIITYVEKADANALIPPRDVIPIIVFSLVCTLLVFLLARVLSRSRETAAVIASCIILGFFHLWPIFLATVFLVGVGILTLRLLRRRIGWEQVNLVFSTVAVLMLGFYGFRFLGMIRGQHAYPAAELIQDLGVPAGDGSSSAHSPDIYYIILDGYGRADMLETIHGYDNSAFLDELGQRGFFVAPKSQANYPRTLLSLASAMNLQYLDRMAEVMGDSSRWWPVTEALKHSQLRTLVEGWGYQTIFLASGWDYSDIRDGDGYYSPDPIMLRDFEKTFIRTTNLRFLGQVDRFGISYPSYDMHRELVRYEFSTLAELASTPGPKFVFAHILAPHAPFVFDRNGGPVDPDYPYSIFDARALIGNVSAYRQSYLDQLTYINQLTLTMIDGVLAGSDNPPVIILQADHGPDTFLDYSDYNNSCLSERFSILNAYYLPGILPGQVPDRISPVNSFRLVANLYLGTSFEYLPDQQFFSPHPHLYQFQDITGLTDAPCDLSGEERP